MKRLLVFGLILLLLLLIPLGILIAGDYYNFPLWPINSINRIIAVNIHCSITDPFPIPINRVTAGHNYVVVDIRDSKQRPIDLFRNETLMTDSEGLLRIYLAEGTYLIKAYLIGVKGERIVKFGTGEINQFKKIDINRANNKIELHLYQLEESDIRQMMSRMRKYLAEGYLEQALTLAEGLERIDARSAEDATLKGEAIKSKEQLSEINKLVGDLSLTEIDHYNSMIIIYRKILNLLMEIQPDSSEDQIRVVRDDQVVYPLRVIEALERTKTRIIESHIQNIREFIFIGKYSKATDEWMRLKNNFHLFTKSPYLSDNSDLLYEKAKTIIEAGHQQINDHLAEVHSRALKEYHRGDFETSREKFNQVYEEYVALQDQSDIDEDILKDVYSYISDLNYINKGYDHFLLGDHWQAAESFRSIIHWTPALQQMVEDMRLPVKRTLQLSPPTPQPVSPAR